MFAGLVLTALLATLSIVSVQGQEEPAEHNDSEACCQTRAIVIPALAFFLDVGLPVFALLVAFICLRKAAKANTKNAEAEAARRLPLISGEASANNAFEAFKIAVKPCKPNSNSDKGSWLWSRVFSFWQNNPHKAALLRLIETNLASFSAMGRHSLLTALDSTESGLDALEAARRLKEAGPNRIADAKPPSILTIAFRSLFEPFNLLMLTVAVLTLCPPNEDRATFGLIMGLLAGAVILRFIEEYKGAHGGTGKLEETSATVTVIREGAPLQVSADQLVRGDILELSGDDVVPADLRILDSQNLHIGMSSLTGETLPIPKTGAPCCRKSTVLEHSNIALKGSSVIHGHAKGIVVGCGNMSYVAALAAALPSGRNFNAFDAAIRRVVYLFIAFILVMVPIVIVLNGVSTGVWSDALAFGLSVAVGLSPQMMPMIVTANLSRGSRLMRKQNAIVRRLDAVQNLGAMDVLCTDKTGTLTIDAVKLVQHLDVDGADSQECLRLGYANAKFQGGKKNVMDEGILSFVRDNGISMEESHQSEKVAEIPFDFERRMVSVILKSASLKQPILITKGAFEEVLLKCTHMTSKGGICAISDTHRTELACIIESLNNSGLRVLAVATRSFTKHQSHYSEADEHDLLLKGYLAFQDPPKLDAQPALKGLKDLGIDVKVLTGDSLAVAKQCCLALDIPAERCITGSELSQLEDAALATAIEQTTVFAKVTPQQKMAVIDSLQKQKHVCGFMGDGTNDGLALRKADVGICVDSGTDVAKQAADIILLDKDLKKLAQGVITGRTTFGNTMKYIKCTASSSFGNTFSILAAAAWLPFNPLAPIQVLALNTLYNISQMAIPWDTMDEEFLQKPRRWSARYVGTFMLIIGPISSIYDMATYVTAWYLFKTNNDSPASVLKFTTIWFLESLMTQTFVPHLLRTEKIPFLQSRASWPLLVSSFSVMAAGFAICYIPALNAALQLAPPPAVYYPLLAATMAAYCVTVQIFKVLYIRILGTWQ